MLDEKAIELIAVGATITANCLPCLEFHVRKAREAGAAEAEIAAAIGAGREVRAGAAARMDRYAVELTGAPQQQAAAGCGCG